MVCGGGARLPAVAARAAREGLSGIEFGVNIPGHHRRGRADERERLRRRARARRSSGWRSPPPAGVERRSPVRARLRLPALEPAPRGRSSPRAGLLLASRRRHGARQGDLAEMRAPSPRGPAAGDQDLRLDLQEPRGSPRRGALGRAAAERGRLQRRGGRRRPASPPSTPTSSRTPGSATTADVVAVMAEGRRRVLERFGVELEPEVQTLGDVRFPWL